MLKAFHEISEDVLASVGSSDDLSEKIYAGYGQFRALAMDWSDVSERAPLWRTVANKSQNKFRC